MGGDFSFAAILTVLHAFIVEIVTKVPVMFFFFLSYTFCFPQMLHLLFGYTQATFDRWDELDTRRVELLRRSNMSWLDSLRDTFEELTPDLFNDILTFELLLQMTVNFL